jgi:hypothetical protein
MSDDINGRVERMSPEERATRFQELREKLGMAEPRSISGGKKPTEGSLDEHEEYQCLKQFLGYK